MCNGADLVTTRYLTGALLAPGEAGCLAVALADGRVRAVGQEVQVPEGSIIAGPAGRALE